MPKRRTPEIRLEADTNNKHADLYLFGVIGSWWDENTAEEVLSELRSYDNLDTITVYISTVGGTFLDGLPIYNLLKNHPATVTTRVIGYALSMGSVIMLAGDRIEAAQNSLVMIHNAQGIAWGSANDMRATAEIMDKHEQAIIPRYRERMSLSNDEIQALLDAETWYTADEALAAGLIDEIIDPVDLDDTDQQQPENSWKFAAENFRHPPEAFQHRIENALQDKPNWLLSLLNKTVGKPPALPAHLNEPETTDHEDEPVTPEESYSPRPKHPTNLIRNPPKLLKKPHRTWLIRRIMKQWWKNATSSGKNWHRPKPNWPSMRKKSHRVMQVKKTPALPVKALKPKSIWVKGNHSQKGWVMSGDITAF